MCIRDRSKIADFDGFMTAIEAGRFDGHVHFKPQTEFLIDEAGNIAVDRVGRFERLATEFRSICLAAGVDAPSLPMLKHTRHGHYADYYDERTRTIVADRFATDLDRFGYRFQESTLWLRIQRPITLARHRIDQVLHR